jgi:predicted RNase H-like nuclease (RuvC/YqgF family)
MVTRTDLAGIKVELNTDITQLEEKLVNKMDKLDISIHRELDDIKQQIENKSGYGKEIDHALERIAAIEKDFGINKKIAAYLSPTYRGCQLLAAISAWNVPTRATLSPHALFKRAMGDAHAPSDRRDY